MYNKKYCNTECCNSIRREVEYILLTAWMGPGHVDGAWDAWMGPGTRGRGQNVRHCRGGRRGAGASSRLVRMLAVQGTCLCVWCTMRVSGRTRTRGDMHGRDVCREPQGRRIGVLLAGGYSGRGSPMAGGGKREGERSRQAVCIM